MISNTPLPKTTYETTSTRYINPGLMIWASITLCAFWQGTITMCGWEWNGHTTDIPLVRLPMDTNSKKKLKKHDSTRRVFNPKKGPFIWRMSWNTDPSG